MQTPAQGGSLPLYGRTGQVGVPYSSSLVASGGVPPYTYGGTPVECLAFSLNTATGVVTGTPTQDGKFDWDFTVTDSVGDTTNPEAGVWLPSRRRCRLLV
ncbi:hypothetical protein [Tunturiibacter gelidiferens]|uniref:hypothetical protein n=1 Tax=Tunturiibacter gelidiferens TaxID=3069689 RepID=UPI003D9BAA91